MYKKELCKRFGILLLLCTTHVNAANVWSGNKTVINVQGVQTGGFLVFFDSEVDPVCTAAGTNSVYIYPNKAGVTIDGANSLLSIALTALTTGYKLNIMYDDATSNCWGQYIKITK